MGVFTRFNDIINSNISALLDRAEDPEKMVRLITLEMEETIVEVRATSARYIADKKVIHKRIAWLQRESEEWENKAEVAISKGRDDLAKAALREKTETDHANTVLTADLEQIENNITKLQQDTSRLQLKLEEARTRQKALIIRGQTVSSRLRVKKQLHNDDIHEALSRFESYERQLDDLEGQIESYDLGQQSLAAEIASLETDETLDRELAALKSRFTQSRQVQTG